MLPHYGEGMTETMSRVLNHGDQASCPCQIGSPWEQNQGVKRTESGTLRNVVSSIKAKVVPHRSAKVVADNCANHAISCPHANPTRPAKVDNNPNPMTTRIMETHIGVPSQNSQPLEPPQVSSPAQRTQSRMKTIDGMRIFSREVDSVVTDGFKIVCEKLEPPLIELLRKKSVQFRPLGIQLLILGHSEQTAKPWIVVMCPKPAKRRVAHFFQEPFAKHICRSPGLCQFDFEVAVVGRPLKPTEGEPCVQVLAQSYTSSEYSEWTPRIKIEHSGSAHYATLGGLVRVRDFHGKEQTYGLTAGHVLPLCPVDDQDVQSTANHQDTDKMSCSSDSSSAPANSDFDEEDFTHIDQAESEAEVENFEAQPWSSLGSVNKASYSPRARNRDWALIELTDLRQGRFTIPSTKQVFSGTAAAPSPQSVGKKLFRIHNHPILNCSISNMPARALLPFGNEFVDVHVLHVQDDQGLSR
jgi:hypothetical protein